MCLCGLCLIGNVCVESFRDFKGLAGGRCEVGWEMHVRVVLVGGGSKLMVRINTLWGHST